MPVGASDRTRGKHALLDHLLARETGIMCNPKSRQRLSFATPHYTMIDLTAGDGLPTEYSEETSPMILCRYANQLRATGIPVDVFLIEKDAATYDRLEGRSGLRAHTIFADARILETLEPIRAKSLVFIHADPNHVEDWPISDGLLRDANSGKWFVTMLVTMGCNVGGLKRLPVNARKPWEERISHLIEQLARRHDCMLVTLCQDAHQWAYLVIGPSVWREQYEQDAHRAFNYWSKGIDITWYRQEPSAFWAEVRRLVYTKGELDAA